jgi:hypothetical protein
MMLSAGEVCAHTFTCQIWQASRDVWQPLESSEAIPPQLIFLAIIWSMACWWGTPLDMQSKMYSVQ